VWTGAKMIVWGGRETAFIDLSSGGIYDLATGRWTPTAETSTLSHPSTAIWTGSRMIVFAGAVTGGSSRGGIFDPVVNAWAALAAAGRPTDRFEHSAVWTGDRMLVFGGRVSGTLALSDGAILR